MVNTNRILLHQNLGGYYEYFGKKVMFRAIEEDDALILNKWANDPDIQSMLGGWHFPTSMQDQNQWISSLNCNNTNQRFAIELIESKKIIGSYQFSLNRLEK